jgi:hypothetical protein
VFELGTLFFVHREISELEIAEEGWDLGSDHSSVISVFLPTLPQPPTKPNPLQIPVRCLCVALLIRAV